MRNSNAPQLPPWGRRQSPRIPGALVLVWMLALEIFAALPAGRRRFDVPVGLAEATLRTFVAQADIELVYTIDTVVGVRTNALKGELPVVNALDQMLATTGLVVVKDEKTGALMVHRQPTAPTPASRSPEKPQIDSKETPIAMKERNRLALFAAWLGFALTPSHAAEADGTHSTAPVQHTGVIEGRVFNTSSGNYLNNVRITVPGSAIETTTNEYGGYRLTNVPSGDVVVTATFLGLGQQSAKVSIREGRVARQDFSLSLGGAGAGTAAAPVQLDAFTVEERQLSGQAVALQEQRHAANIKNVVSFDEFGDMGEGNVGEYIKYIPGLDMTYVPTNPTFVAIRGMPASGTVVMIDGAQAATAASSVTRGFDLTVTATGNVDRVEVTKTPTPDMPANAVGGSINIVSKTGFGRTRPLFTYNAFLTYDEALGIKEFSPTLRTRPGPDDKSTYRPSQLAGNLSYIWPISKSFALTFAGSYAPRYADWQVHNTTWDQVRYVQTTNRQNLQVFMQVPTSGKVTVDWRLGHSDMVRASLQRSHMDIQGRQNSFQVNLGANAAGGATFSQGAPTGAGSIGHTYDYTHQIKNVDLATLTYRHDGTRWKWDLNLTYSKGTYTNKDMEDGSFASLTTSNAIDGNLILRLDGLDGIADQKVPRITAVDRAGNPVDIYSAANRSLTSAGALTLKRDQEIHAVGVNVGRNFSLAVPLALKGGVLFDRHYRDVSAPSFTYVFMPPGVPAGAVGAAGRLATNWDLIAKEYSARRYATDVFGNRVKYEFLSTAKVFDLYKQHPNWFVLDQVAAHQSEVTNRKQLEETVEAAYLRADAKFLDGRLWLVGGVRFESTTDKGQGPLNDIAATFVRNPDGRFALNAAGARIPVTTDPLARARLQYKLLGASADRSYEGYYPSINSSYSLTDNVVARAAYARTIGRPELGSILPGATVTDPDSIGTKRISVVNSGLKPWTADNYDLTVEAYNVKGATASVSLFQKGLTGFFTSTVTDATRPLVESYDLPWEDYYSTYEIATQQNGGSATLRGLELSYRQTLLFLPGWGRGIQTFINVTTMSLSGPDRNNLQNFAPRNLNWGVSYTRATFNVNLNVSQSKGIRTGSVGASATVPAGIYSYQRNSPRVDASFEYSFSKRLGLYGGVRNMLSVPNARTRTNRAVPDYTNPVQIQYTSASFTLGMKGVW